MIEKNREGFKDMSFHVDMGEQNIHTNPMMEQNRHENLPGKKKLEDYEQAIYDNIPQKLELKEHDIPEAYLERDMIRLSTALVETVPLITELLPISEDQIEEAHESRALLMPHEGMAHERFIRAFTARLSDCKPYLAMKLTLMDKGYKPVR